MKQVVVSMSGIHDARRRRAVLAVAAVLMIPTAQAAPSEGQPMVGVSSQLPESGRVISSVSDLATHRRGCVTRREFRRAKRGMKRGRIVRRIFKARGQRNPYVPANRNIWGYSACKRGYFVEVDYTNLRRGKPFRMVRKGWYRQEGGGLRHGAVGQKPSGTRLGPRSVNAR